MSQFPPAGFVETTSVVDGITVYKPIEITESHEQVVAFRCPQCQGETAFSAQDGGVTCTYCGYHEAPQANLVGKSAETFEFTVETVEQATHGWGTERQDIACQTCHSHLIVEPGNLTTSCPFCGSNKVIQTKAPQDSLRPRFLVPFSVTDDAAHDHARAWLGNSWFVPKELKQLASIGEFTPMYLPYWTFDAGGDAHYRAEVGERRTRRNSKGQTESYIAWRWTSGHVVHTFRDVVVAGSKRLSTKMQTGIGRYDLNALVEYAPSFLAGTQAVAYEGDLETAWATGRRAMRESMRKKCRSDISQHHVRNFSMKMEFDDEAWRYILLPVYLAHFHYQNNHYQFVINGQTGEVAGQRPAAWRKIWIASAIPIILALVVLLISVLGSLDLYLFSVILFVIGIILAVGLSQQAGALENV